MSKEKEDHVEGVDKKKADEMQKMVSMLDLESDRRRRQSQNIFEMAKQAEAGFKTKSGDTKTFTGKLDKKSVEILMSQIDTSKQESEALLRANNGDLVAALNAFIRS